MRTTRSDYEYDNLEAPPSYSDIITADGANHNNASNLPPADEYRRIEPPRAFQDGWRNRNSANQSCSQQVSIGSATTARMHERLSDPAQLWDYVNDYLRVMQPRPQIRIQGSHWETRKKNNKSERERVFDFDVVFSLQPFLYRTSGVEEDNDWWIPSTSENSDKVYRGSWKKSRAKGFSQDIEVGADRKPELLDWCEDMCSNKSPLKIFRVSREVTGLDTEYIKRVVEPYVRQTQYRGHIDITFPISEKNVDIYSAHWVNQARIGWVRWLFYLTFLWIFTWPILFFMTKRWSVYNVEWRFSQTVQDENGRQRKAYATISEDAWVERHAKLLQCLVLEHFHGDATKFSVDVDVQRGAPSSAAAQTSNANVDAAVNFLRGGVSVWNSLNGRPGDAQGWGADS